MVDKLSKLFGQPVVFNWQVFSLFLAHVAQSVEHFLGKEEVIGSNPIVGSKEEVHFIIFSKNKEGLSHVEAEV
jgi:formate dehydrogenase maturation protein FdhE